MDNDTDPNYHLRYDQLFVKKRNFVMIEIHNLKIDCQFVESEDDTPLKIHNV